MIKVLMCGNHPSNKGGMTSVISQLRGYSWEKEDIRMKFIPTFYPGGPVTKLVYFGISYLRVFLALLIYRPDIVHMHMSYKGSFHRKYLIHTLCRCFGVKDTIHLHGSEFEEWYQKSGKSLKKKVRKLLRESELLFVLGDRWESVVKNIEITANTVVLNNAVPIPETVVKWNEKELRVLYMGVLIPRKGIDVLLQSLDILKRTGCIGNMRLSIAGTGEEEGKLKEHCSERGLEDIVAFHGWITGSRKRDLIMESQIAVLPSYHEGLPISVLEYISYGMPVVATRVGDMEAAVKDGVNGFLVEPGNAEALADKLAEAADRGTFMYMSEQSRRLAKEKFSEEKFFEAVIRCYRGLARSGDEG